jgi:steroid delta-isomerase-like uncharacterized protein
MMRVPRPRARQHAGRRSFALLAIAAAAYGCRPLPQVSDGQATEPGARTSDAGATSFDYRKYVDSVYNAHNPDAVDQFFTSDVVVHSVAPDVEGGNGIGYVKDVVRALVAAFPDLKLTVEDTIQQDDRLSARVVLEGTHKGRFAGIGPTGRTVKVTNFAIYRLKDGKISEMWSLVDMHQLRRQLTQAK